MPLLWILDVIIKLVRVRVHRYGRWIFEGIIQPFYVWIGHGNTFLDTLVAQVVPSPGWTNRLTTRRSLAGSHTRSDRSKRQGKFREPMSSGTEERKL